MHEIRGTNFWDTLYLMQWNLQESNVLPDNFFHEQKRDMTLSSLVRSVRFDPSIVTVKQSFIVGQIISFPVVLS